MKTLSLYCGSYVNFDNGICAYVSVLSFNEHIKVVNDWINDDISPSELGIISLKAGLESIHKDDKVLLEVFTSSMYVVRNYRKAIMQKNGIDKKLSHPQLWHKTIPLLQHPYHIHKAKTWNSVTLACFETSKQLTLNRRYNPEPKIIEALNLHNSRKRIK